MKMFELLKNRIMFAPEDGGAGGASDASAATDGETGATDDKGGNAGQNAGGTQPAVTNSVLGGKPGEKPEEAPAGDGAAKEGTEGEAPDPLDSVPEDGKYEYSLPDGFEVDEKAQEQVSSIFKEAGLTKKQAGIVAEKYASLVQEQAKQQAEVADKTFSGWLEQARSDEEIGGQKWDASVAAANSALSRFGTPELDVVLEASGVGTHPEMIRVFARIGAAIADDKFVSGQAAVDNRPVEERMYGKTTPSGKKG